MNMENERGSTIVHSFQLRLKPVCIHKDEALEYLGGQRDESGQSRTDLAETKKMVLAHCAKVGATAVSTGIKVGSTKLVAYAKARYKAKLAA